MTHIKGPNSLRLTVWVLSIALLLSAAPALSNPEADYEFGVQAYDRGDLIDAMQALQRAAAEGHVPSILMLGFIWDQSEENELAVEQYRRAVELGSPEGQLRLGQMYLKGEGVPLDIDQGRDWVLKAVDQGYAPAMVTIALGYAGGHMGLEQNNALAIEWLSIAADQGHAPAMQELAAAYAGGRFGLPVDPEKAAAWRAKAEATQAAKR